MLISLPFILYLASSSAALVASITSRTPLTTDFGVMLLSILYLSWISLLLFVSFIALSMEPVILSAYIITLPSIFRAALPTVCIRDVSERRNPSLSASSIATKDTSGKPILPLKVYSHKHIKLTDAQVSYYFHSFQGIYIRMQISYLNTGTF